jgi:uncharacterized protein YukE
MSWRGPAPLHLQLPAALAEVDPDALRQRAAEHTTEATALRDQAAALRVAVRRLVPAVWLGLGALGFAGAALAQAEALDAIATAGGDLAEGLSALATALAAARADALAAVRLGARVDDEMTDLNRRLARRPEPERLEPDPTVVAADLGAATAAAQRLAVAEEAARSAWRHATAVFDLVAYRMPAMQARMSGPNSRWQPPANLQAVPAAEWRRLVGNPPVCVEAGYAGSGVILGPDGRRYPLVVPWIERGGVRFTGDQEALVDPAGTVETLGGTDPDWRLIGLQAGVDEFGPRATTATKAAIVTAGLAGLAPTTVGRLRPDLLARLRLSPTGYPTLEAGPTGVPAPRKGGTGRLPRSALVRDADGTVRWDSDTGKATPVGPNVLALAEGGLAAAGTARRLDDARAAAYRVAFEENADGRIRARLTLYQVRSDASGTSILTSTGSVDGAGTLSTTPVRYRAPKVPVMRPASGSDADAAVASVSSSDPG